jgi:glycerol-3-phosphate dehydrogenase (NAD(P)+)
LASRAKNATVEGVQLHESVALYGIGNFGYAMLRHLDAKWRTGVRVRAYDRNIDTMQELVAHRRHPLFHQDACVSDHVGFVDEAAMLLAESTVLVLAVSSEGTREVLERLRPHLPSGILILNTAKALDYQTGKRLSEVAAEVLGGHAYEYALLSGGTIARDLFEQQPLGVDVACGDPACLVRLEALLTSPNLHVYPTTDLTGAEYAGAFKNVIAILAGIVHGLGFSYGAETHVISRTAQLVAEAIVEHFAAEPSTFSMGRQCWGNDLWMSCTGDTRNREFGILLGRGLSVDEAVSTMQRAHKTVEGLNTIQVLDRIEPIRRIVHVELLHDLIVRRSIDVETIRNYLMRTHL